MTLMAWEHAVRTRDSAYALRERFGLTEDHRGPDWCFQRVGMSKTFMPDGRIICIAGEHEDYYDKDFCIYNDVIVLRPDDGKEYVDMQSGRVEIYGYPEVVFPPTDFHSATLVGDEIYIIGSLGYMDRREGGRTPIAVLDTRDYSIRTVESFGMKPGWVNRHSGAYEPATHSIVVRSGLKFDPAVKPQLSPNNAVFHLHLHDMKWERVRDREPDFQFLIKSDDPYTDGYIEPLPSDFRPRTIAHVYLGTEGSYSDEHAFLVKGYRFRIGGASYYNVVCDGDCPADLMQRVLQEISENLTNQTGRKFMVIAVDPNLPSPTGGPRRFRDWFR